MTNSNLGPIVQRVSRNLSLENVDRISIAHPFTAAADHEHSKVRILNKGYGINVYDQFGREYIDCVSGMWCVNVGYGREEIAVAIADQARNLSYCHALKTTSEHMTSNEPVIRLAERLLDVSPTNMRRVFFCTSGSDANDTQLRIAWYYHALRGRPDKAKVIALRNGYHGSTIGAASITGIDSMHAGFHPIGPKVRHASTPSYYHRRQLDISVADFCSELVTELEQIIEEEGSDTIAAFIAEPIMGGGGVIVPPENYFTAVRQLLDAHDILMIADEIVCGFGRTGQMFGSLTLGFEPDLLTIGKGLTSGYIPMSGCIISDKVWQVLLAETKDLPSFGLGHGFTYTGHPIAAAAANVVLDIMESEGLMERAVDVGAHLRRQLCAQLLNSPIVGEVRGVGQMSAIEFTSDRSKRMPFNVDDKVVQKILDACDDRGVILRQLRGGNAIGIAPPLIIKKKEVDDVVERIVGAIDMVSNNLLK